jgi:hypothetical protein
MKVFLVRLAVLAVLFFTIDYFAGKMLEKGYYHVKSGTIYQSIYGLESSKEDILILGASEVKHGMISSQFEDSLGLSCYNLGFDGNNIYYQYALLREILKRHKPGIVVISSTIAAENENTVVSLLPLSKKYSQIREMVSEISPLEKVKLLSNAYAFNSLTLNIIQGHLAPEPPTKGYRPLFEGEKNMKLESRDYVIETSARSLEYFGKFINLAKSAGCKVVVVNTPKYFINLNFHKTTDIKTLVQDAHITYLDYENDTTYINHRDMFYDGVHLNHKGAVSFTGHFISDIRQRLNIDKLYAGK